MPSSSGKRLFAYPSLNAHKAPQFDFSLRCRSQIQLSSVIETTSDTPRTGPNDIHVGDVLHVTLETTETPFGDPAVSLEMLKGTDRRDKALDELMAAYEKKQPVMGRILNPLNGGYAIGIAGLVGFCPFRLCTLPTASRIGILQPFFVERFRRDPFNMVLEDVHAHQKNFARPPTQSQTVSMSALQPPGLSSNLAPASSTSAPTPSAPAPIDQDDVVAAEQEAKTLMGEWRTNLSGEELPQVADRSQTPTETKS